MTCSSCGHANRSGRKFCSVCGAALAVPCPSCGAANDPEDAFCGECGTALASVEQTPAAAEVERRLVSVLFADVVGSTAQAEGRDAEDVRELLTRYFDAARTVIERYGGGVEKFIGDAVMAVWGTPVAREDDAERAVRAGLELVETVDQLGLTARVGILTGEAAATVGATDQAMVAGDLVNTASRVQSLAEPGTVLVGEATQRASRAAVAYEEAGTHEVKGRDAPIALWRALRVTGRRSGAATPDLLEPPFVVRLRELRILKEAFHASAEARRAQLVSVVGVAGIGKSRLAWELAKYLDGLSELVLWHRGRCLAYGDGVTYSALAEMVRMRCGIAEGEDPESARTKLHTTLQDFVEDLEDREWIEPRLAHLLALDERSWTDQADLFAAWRLFLERLADRYPVVLVFEDVQWADAALLAFVEYLLEWSSAHPVIVIALARPELAERHPGWPQARVNATTLVLDPLPPEAMTELVDGLVPGLPDDVRERVVAQAEGIPLYAVETVRMLLDRGLIERAGEQYQVTGAVEALDVPETLHALVAARLDGLSAEERRVVEGAAVLGKTFMKDALAVLSGIGGAQLDTLLASLVRKELLFLQADPRSPERGQYSFLQDLLRQVAYETLGRKERRTKHLAVAAWLEEHRDDSDVVEIVAAHYVAAYESDPGAADAAATRQRARALLVRAGERATSLAAPADAQRYFERALELTDDAEERAALHEQAGSMATRAGAAEQARRHFEQAVSGFDSLGLAHAAARASAGLAFQTYLDGEAERATTELERAYAILADEEPDADVAEAAAQLGRLLMLTNRYAEALEPLEAALELAEAFRLPELLSQALNTKALVLREKGRREEARALLQHALTVAVEHDLTDAAARANGNLGHVASLDNRFEDSLRFARAHIELARKLGSRPIERFALDNLVDSLLVLGRWDDALALAGQLGRPYSLVEIFVHRGELGEARRLLEEEREQLDAGNPQTLAGFRFAEGVLALAEGRAEEALAAAKDAETAWGQGADQFALELALEAAFALEDTAGVDGLLGQIEALSPGRRTPFLEAIHARGAARRAALRGDASTAQRLFAHAATTFRELEARLALGKTLLDQADWHAAEGRSDEAAPLYAEAAEVFERLGAKPWLQRAQAGVAARPAPTPA